MKLAKFNIEIYIGCNDPSIDTLKHKDGSEDKFAINSIEAFSKSITSVLKEHGFDAIKNNFNDTLDSSGEFCQTTYYRSGNQDSESIKCILMLRVLKHSSSFNLNDNTDVKTWNLVTIFINGREFSSYFVSLDYLDKLVASW